VIIVDILYTSHLTMVSSWAGTLEVKIKMWLGPLFQVEQAWDDPWHGWHAILLETCFGFFGSSGPILCFLVHFVLREFVLTCNLMFAFWTVMQSYRL